MGEEEEAVAVAERDWKEGREDEEEGEDESWCEFGRGRCLRDLLVLLRRGEEERPESTEGVRGRTVAVEVEEIREGREGCSEVVVAESSERGNPLGLLGRGVGGVDGREEDGVDFEEEEVEELEGREEEECELVGGDGDGLGEGMARPFPLRSEEVEGTSFEDVEGLPRAEEEAGDDEEEEEEEEGPASFEALNDSAVSSESRRVMKLSSNLFAASRGDPSSLRSKLGPISGSTSSLIATSPNPPA